MRNRLINLRATLECGQVFHWREREDGAWEGLVGEMPVAVREVRGTLRVIQGDKRAVARYFSMDHDLDAIYAGFPSDKRMRAARY